MSIADKEPDPCETGFATQSIDELADQPVGELRLDTVLSGKSETAAARLDKLEGDRVEQANELRSKFFLVGVSLATACVSASVFMVLFMLFCRQISDPVAIAFMTGLTVEVLGIMVIIANYLFPSGNGKKEEKKEKQLS